MLAQTVEPIAEAILHPTNVGQEVIHEDHKQYKVSKIVKTEIKANSKGHMGSTLNNVY
ncbi:hypothetical protein P4641_03680 [Halalkalibacterium halodurans]|uniref:hypothetical protein n=1 Tax=Halalkalibacterium halodurans TaxID=86665 RepID=UPI002E24F065|nr:hypothetical protein [Halalkalibacterium halodurans]